MVSSQSPPNTFGCGGGRGIHVWSDPQGDSTWILVPFLPAALIGPFTGYKAVCTFAGKPQGVATPSHTKHGGTRSPKNQTGLRWRWIPGQVRVFLINVGSYSICSFLFFIFFQKDWRTSFKYDVREAKIYFAFRAEYSAATSRFFIIDCSESGIHRCLRCAPSCSNSNT